MNTKDYIDFFEELDDEDKLNSRLGIDKRRPYQRMTRKLINEERQFVREQDDSSRSFKFTYKAARFEERDHLERLRARPPGGLEKGIPRGAGQS